MSRNQTPLSPVPIEGSADPAESAKVAGLRYVSDSIPGISRARKGNSFQYRDPDGNLIRDEALLQRIRSLAIPPAWGEVWICPSPNGHIQATARDARGRKQYRYHPRWREVRDETKYGRMIEFAGALPKIRRRVAKDLKLREIPREKLLATVVRLLETTNIRVGNEEYARANKSFGLTTMRTRHVDVSGSTLKFQFRGKSGKSHSITLSDPKLAKIVRRCQDLPGQELFQYLDEGGNRQSISSADVNQYLRDISGQDFTAKDFRTWAGTVLAACALSERIDTDSETQGKKHLAAAIDRVAEQLGNTPAVCRKCYVHPAVLEAYLEGSIPEELRLKNGLARPRSGSGLKPEEKAVLNFLKKRVYSKSRKGKRR